MDVPVPVEERDVAAAERSPEPEQPTATTEPELRPEAPPEPTAASDDVAAQLAALTRRVEELAGGFDAAVREAVAEEVQRVAGELQHTVTALGRILVRDLGKLSQILGEHRDMIVAELRKAPEGGREAASPGGGAPVVEPAVAAGESLPPDDDGPPADDLQGAAARQWRGRRRKG